MEIQIRVVIVYGIILLPKKNRARSYFFCLAKIRMIISGRLVGMATPSVVLLSFFLQFTSSISGRLGCPVIIDTGNQRSIARPTHNLLVGILLRLNNFYSRAPTTK